MGTSCALAHDLHRNLGTGTQTEPDGRAELRKVVEKKLGKQAAGREREREGEMENELCSKCL